MLKDWNIKNKPKFVKSCDKIDWLIDLITNIRSTKVNLNVSPGSFIKMSTAEVNSEKKQRISSQRKSNKVFN